MDNFWASIGGAVVGGILSIAATYISQLCQQKAKEKKRKENLEKEGHYLAILVRAYLNQFVNACTDIAFDDGTIDGQPAHDGIHTPTTNPPKFDPLSLKVNWKILPADLMADILDLPYKTKQLEEKLRYTAECDGPPDYSLFFTERRYSYAALGLEVSSIIRRLQEFANLPEISPIPILDENYQDRDMALKEQLDKMSRQFTKR